MNLRKLNRNQLKIIAIAAMLTDHIAWAFVPLESAAGQLMHFIGRFTGPTMAYLLFEGFLHTRDKKKYAARLGIFALVSWIPFCSFEAGQWCVRPAFGVIYTLFLGFLGMMYCEKRESSWGLADSAVLFGLCMLSMFGDWMCFDVLWPVLLYLKRDDERAKWRGFWLVNIINMALTVFSGDVKWNLYNLGCIVPGLVLQFCYSGEPGRKTSLGKWFFYAFYPLHLLILAAAEIYLK